MTHAPDYRHLPEPVRLDDTVAEQDERVVADAEDLRNIAQDQALLAP
jgi:hypothetical protein